MCGVLSQIDASIRSGEAAKKPTVQEMVGVRLCGMGFLFDILDLRCDGGR